MGYGKTKEITLAKESEKTRQKTNKNSEETIAEGKGQYLKPITERDNWHKNKQWQKKLKHSKIDNCFSDT